jgi:hypothetical protein
VNTVGKRTSTVVWTILLAGIVTAMAGPVRAEPYDPTLIPHRAYGRCYPFASCVAYRQFQILEQRRQQSEDLRRRQQPPASIGIQTPGSFATTPTDEAEIQPDYIESGQIRDEYQGSGEILPELLERRVRPSR